MFHYQALQALEQQQPRPGTTYIGSLGFAPKQKSAQWMCHNSASQVRNNTKNLLSIAAGKAQTSYDRSSTKPIPNDTRPNRYGNERWYLDPVCCAPSRAQGGLRLLLVRIVEKLPCNNAEVAGEGLGARLEVERGNIVWQFRNIVEKQPTKEPAQAGLAPKLNKFMSRNLKSWGDAVAKFV